MGGFLADDSGLLCINNHFPSFGLNLDDGEITKKNIEIEGGTTHCDHLYSYRMYNNDEGE